MNDVDAAQHFEKLAGEVTRTAIASRGEIELARLRLCQLDQIHGGARGYRWMDLEHVGRGGYQRYGRKAFEGVVRKLPVKRCVNRVTERRHEQRVAVWRCTRDDVAAH